MPLLLEGKVDDRDETILRLRTQLRESETARLTEQGRANAIEAGVRDLRESLAPLYRALRQVFGEIEAMGITSNTPASAAAQSDSRVTAVWESWIQRLGEGPGKVIRALLLHREMNTQQLAIATGYHRTTVPTYIHKLKTAGLINKNGDKFSLKEL